MNEDPEISATKQVRLGRLPMKSTRKALQFSDFFKFVTLPKSQLYWKNKSMMPLRSFGNLGKVGPQANQHLLVADIPRVDDAGAAFQRAEGFRSEEPVRVGDDAEHAHDSLIERFTPWRMNSWTLDASTFDRDQPTIFLV